MDITTYIQDKKALVSSFITSYLKQTVLPQVSSVGSWGNDAVNRILSLTIEGKMLRTALVFLSNDICAETQNTDTLVKTAAALELIQTGLLIHDDIMDKDTQRRGLDSIHIQYQKIFSSDGTKNPDKTGESFAICAGDVAYFLAYQILGSIKPTGLSQTLTTHFSTQNTLVCIGQMLDVYGGQTTKQLSEREILAIYEHKTARYTTLLPMTAGALIAGATEKTIKQIEKLGIALGILFQIKDDHLNMFGDSKMTGKPIGSDIREGKQTLYRYFLFSKATGNDNDQLKQIFGNPNITDKDIVFVRNQITHLKIEQDICDIVDKQHVIIKEVLDHTPMKNEGKLLLNEFITYLSTRNR